MARYRITLEVSSPVPLTLEGKKLIFQGQDVFVTTAREPPTLAISPIVASGRVEAFSSARMALNNLLNYLTATMQYCAILTPDYYAYENLDDENDRGQVVSLVTAIDYGFVPDIPDGYSLDTQFKSAAFLRRGDTSPDPFDRFRNYYLAVDAVGKLIEESEKDSKILLKTIKKVATKEVLHELNERLQNIMQIREPVNAAKNLNDALYKRFRCALMHSGKGHDFTPFDPSDEEFVHSALPIMRGVALQYVTYERRVF